MAQGLRLECQDCKALVGAVVEITLLGNRHIWFDRSRMFLDPLQNHLPVEVEVEFPPTPDKNLSPIIDFDIENARQC